VDRSIQEFRLLIENIHLLFKSVCLLQLFKTETVSMFNLYHTELQCGLIVNMRIYVSLHNSGPILAGVPTFQRHALVFRLSRQYRPQEFPTIRGLRKISDSDF
jgi:hypothetical protein